MRLTVRPARRCVVRLSSVALLSASTFGDLLGSFGTIFLSLIWCLQLGSGVGDTQHHFFLPVCHPGDTGCVNQATFAIDGTMSTTADIWEALASAVEGTAWRPELAPWVEI